MFRLSLLLLAFCATSACTSVVDIEIDDNVSFSNLETSFPLTQEDNPRIRFRGARVSGDLDQSLDLDDRIGIGGDFVKGPAEVSGDIELNYFSVAIGGGDIYLEPSLGPFRISLYLGLAFTDFDLRVQNASREFNKSDQSTEAYLQYGLYHTLNESVDVGFTWAASVGRHLSGISEIDLKLDYEFYKQMRVSGGYRWFNYTYNNEVDDSDIQVEFDGPFIGLNLPF